jgi:hypothetical protein
VIADVDNIGLLSAHYHHQRKDQKLVQIGERFEDPAARVLLSRQLPE